MSLYPRPCVANTSVTGLAGNGLGVTVLSWDKSVLVARFTANITEYLTSGIYSTTISNFDSTWSGQIVWDNNGSILVIEDYTGSSIQNPVIAPAFIQITVSYISVEDASIYFSTRLNTQTWDYATPSDQMKALCQATRSIDRLNFVGCKASWTQPLQWPRIVGPQRIGQYSPAILPPDIQIATCEIALNLLDGIDPDLEDELLNSQSDAYATVRITSDSKVARDHIKAGIISIEAWRLLLPWLQDPRAINLRRG